MKITSAIIGVLLIAFAVVQYNDPDPWLWIIYYGIVGCLGILGAAGKHSKLLIVVFVLIGVIWSITLFSGFLEFLKSEASIDSTMSKEKYYIEEAREFLGLMIALAGLGFYYFHSTRIKKENK